MTPRTRLSLFLTPFLAGCGVLGVGPLDDTACLMVDLGATCPDPLEASEILVGTTVCDQPVREVVRIGELVSQEDVVPTGYGYGFAPYGGSGATTTDTGQLEPVTQCCYEAAYRTHVGENCVVGRPLRVAGRMVSARPEARSDWARPSSPELQGLSAEARAVLARCWEDAALLEHASVPAFGRMVLDLVALGAPPELIARTSAAIADEVLHAELCFGLASAYAGAPGGPGPLPVGSRRRASLRRLAVETFREGCVGEMLAVGLAAAQLRETTDPAVRAVLLQILDDEARHAELAWDTVRWAVAAGGAPVARALARELAALALPERAAGPRPVGVGDHGIPAEETVVAALRGILDQVIRPSAAELLAA